MIFLYHMISLLMFIYFCVNFFYFFFIISFQWKYFIQLIKAVAVAVSLQPLLPSDHPTISLFIHPSIHLSICLSIHLFLVLFFFFLRFFFSILLYWIKAKKKEKLRKKKKTLQNNATGSFRKRCKKFWNFISGCVIWGFSVRAMKILDELLEIV